MIRFILKSQVLLYNACLCFWFLIPFQDIYFSVLDGSEGLLPGIKNVISKVFLPAVLATHTWGALNQTKQGHLEKQGFTETLNRYLAFLDGKIHIERVRK